MAQWKKKCIISRRREVRTFVRAEKSVTFCKFTAYYSGEITISLHFTAKLCIKFAAKKPTFHRLSYIFFRFFLDPGKFMIPASIGTETRLEKKFASRSQKSTMLFTNKISKSKIIVIFSKP